MKAHTDPSDPVWPGYYDIEDLIHELKNKKVIVEVHTVPNQGISYGQYIRAYNICKQSSPLNNFDYYIFMEDNYAPVLSNFDQKLIEIHTLQKTGVLCAWANTMGLGIYHAAHSLCIIDKNSMSTAFRNVNEQLDRLINIRPCECQLVFSQMFTDFGIPLTDYSLYYYTPYWTGRTNVDCCRESPQNPVPIFAPFQLVRDGIPTLNNIFSRIDFSSVTKHSRLIQERYYSNTAHISRGKRIESNKRSSNIRSSNIRSNHKMASNMRQNVTRKARQMKAL
jgi:hypothetical protein